MEYHENEHGSGPGVQLFWSAGTTGGSSEAAQQCGPSLKMNHYSALTSIAIGDNPGYGRTTEKYR